GDAVGILLPVMPANYVALLGAMAAGIAFPINWMLQPRQIGALLQAGRVRVLVALGPTAGFDIWEKVEALPEPLRCDLHVLRVRADRGSPPVYNDFEQACRGQPDERLRFERRADPEDIAAWIHTGGTTGHPKVARIPQRAIVYKCWAYAALLGLQPQHV